MMAAQLTQMEQMHLAINTGPPSENQQNSGKPR